MENPPKKMKKDKNQSTLSSFFQTTSTLTKPSVSTSNITPYSLPLETSDVQIESMVNVSNDFTSTLTTSNVSSTPNISDEFISTLTASTVTDYANDNSVNHGDIGLVIRRMQKGERITDLNLEQCLNNRWAPKTKAELPFSMKGNEKRYLGFQHFTTFPWVAVSNLKDYEGAWCVWCAFFTVTGKAGGFHNSNSVKLGNLVTRPLKNFKKLTGKDGVLSMHHNSQYHKENAERATNFLKRAVENSELDVRNLQNKAREEAVMQNRKNLEPIVDTILFCGRQNLALRGHRDSGRILSNEPFENDGNFRALLRLRIRSGDCVLQNHCENAPENAQYTSPTIQNDILESSLRLIQKDIVADVSKVSCFSIICDETMDRGKRELMVIAIRYVSFMNGKATIIEDPICLSDAFKTLSNDMECNACEEEVKLNGENIAKLLKAKCHSLGLQLSKCVGLGMDGAASLSSESVGAAVLFKKDAPLANYYHCMMHNFNLCAMQSVKITPIRSCMDKVRELSNFFSSSAKRNHLLKEVISENELTPNQKKKSLKTLCATRFVERHDAIITALELIPYVDAALQKISSWNSADSRSAADILLRGIEDFGFIISLHALARVSSIFVSISRHLQTANIDIIKALGDINFVADTLAQLREDAVNEFNVIYNDAKLMCTKLEIPESKPRCASRSIYRATAGLSNDQDTESYFRINMFVPLLDTLSNHIKDRFGETHSKSLALSHLVPSRLGSFNDIEPAVDMYASLLDSKIQVRGEFDIWKAHWKSQNLANQVENGIAALDKCSPNIMPNIHKLLTILSTLPVTTAEAERVFSKVERTATAARAHMSEDRLEALVMIYTHRNRTPSIESVVKQFSLNSRRILL